MTLSALRLTQQAQQEKLVSSKTAVVISSRTLTTLVYARSTDDAPEPERLSARSANIPSRRRNVRHNKSTLARILESATIVLAGFALFLISPPIAHAQSTIYALTQSGIFGTLNLSNGTFTQISTPGFEPAGLAGLGGNLFAAPYPSNTLYEVNLSNGNFATIGSGTADYYDFGGTTTGLYAIGTDQNLYSVNAATGASTLIGPTGLGSGGYQSLSGGGTALYTAVPDTSGQFTLLYSVNTTTGAATEIGNTGIAADVSSIGFAFGQLYAADISGNYYTLNTSTGAATLIGNSGQDLWGLGIPPMTISVLHNFTGGMDGSNPFSGMVFDSAGNLYGTAGAGGTGSCTSDGLQGCGTGFKLAKRNGSFTMDPLYEFRGGTDGSFPLRPMTVGPNGSLYGATVGGGEGTCSFDGSSGCGTLYNLAPPPTFPRTPLTPWNERVLYRFTGADDGGSPFSTLLFDASGNIYGTTVFGGTNNLGTVFKMTPAGGGNYTESAIYSFAGGTDGENPYDGLIADTAGNYYGTTANGGGSTNCTSGCGTVFELLPNGSGWMEKVLYRFQGPADGENPDGGVVMDGAGNLYGNTWQGGPGGGGTVYKLTNSGGNWTETTIYSVPVAGYAVGRLFMDSSGNLYDPLQGGGGFGLGQIFELMPSNGSWTYVDLYDFVGAPGGATPIGGVVLDSSGNIYGTTTFGGTNTCGGGSYACGTVWKIAP